MGIQPCPFCGSTAQLGEHLRPQWFFVNCTDCMASTNVLLGDTHQPTEDEALAAWNTRTKPAIKPKQAAPEWTEAREAAHWKIFGE